MQHPPNSGGWLFRCRGAKLTILFVTITLISAVSFIGFGLGYLYSPTMRQEFVRYGLGKYRVVIAILQLSGAVGQIVGLGYPLLGCFASGGLALMMFVALLVRRRIGDRYGHWIPAAMYLVGNVYLVIAGLYR